MRNFRILPKADLYFMKVFLGICAMATVGALFLLVVGDLTQRTDEFAEFSKGSEYSLAIVLGMIVQYYLSFGPAMILQNMLPLIISIAGVLTVTLSSVNNEYTVLRSSGVSLRRSILPLVVATLLVGYSVHWTRDLYLPFLIRKSNIIRTEIKPTGARPLSLVIRDGDEIRSISMGHFDLDENRYVAHNLRIEIRSAKTFYGGSDQMQAYTAWEAYLQPRTDIADKNPDDDRVGQWRPNVNALKNEYTRSRQESSPWREALPTYVTPAMLERQALGVDVMTWPELRRLGSEEPTVRAETYRRMSEPWALAALLGIVVVTALRLSSRGREPSYIINMVLAIVISGLYLVVRGTFMSLGESGTLPLIMAAWLPVVLIGGAAIFMANRLEN